MKRFPQLLLALLLIAGTSCDKGDEPDLNINLLNGLWVDLAATETATVNSYLSYHFKANNEIEVLRTLKDESLNDIVGYRYRGLGTYSVKGSSITMTITQIYLENPQIDGYSMLDDMILSDGTSEEVVNAGFEDNHQFLTFDRPCGPNSICMARQTLRKSQVPF